MFIRDAELLEEHGNLPRVGPGVVAIESNWLDHDCWWLDEGLLLEEKCLVSWKMR